MRTIALACLFTVLLTTPLLAQQTAVGGRGGISIFSSQGSSAGLQLGPTFDYELKKGLLLGAELDLNTQSGTPVELAGQIKYLLDVSRPNITPYIDGGLGLWFVTNGPYLGLQVGGGAYFKISEYLSVPADIQLGPVFTSGSSTFYFAMTSGIRYQIPLR
jgi:hypothetical protein